MDVAFDDMLTDFDGGLDINPEPFPGLDRFASLGFDLKRQPDFIHSYRKAWMNFSNWWTFMFHVEALKLDKDFNVSHQIGRFFLGLDNPFLHSLSSKCLFHQVSDT